MGLGIVGNSLGEELGLGVGKGLVDFGTLLVATVIGREKLNSVGGGENGLVEEFDNRLITRVAACTGGLLLKSAGKILLGSQKVVLDGFGDLSGSGLGSGLVLVGAWLV